MKILVVNLHSARNAGDLALLQVGIQQLRAAFPGAQLTLALTDPDSFPAQTARAEDSAIADPDITVIESFFAWFKRSPTARGGRVRVLAQAMALLALGLSMAAAVGYRWLGVRHVGWLPARYRPAVAGYLDADLVVSCAGNFIYSRGHVGGLPLLMPLYTLAYGRLAGKPVVMLPQTIGPLWRGWERRMVKRLLHGLQLITVRDPQSAALLHALGLPAERVHLFPDVAFLYAGAPAAAGCELLARYGVIDELGGGLNIRWDARLPRPWLGVTLINWGAQHPHFRRQAAYEEAVVEALAAYCRVTGGAAILFAQVCGPTSAEDDRVPARRVAARLAERRIAHCFVDEEVPGPLLHAAYGRMDYFLGSRLHSNIFALAQAVPVLAVAYQDKTHGVMRMLGLGQWVEDIDRVTGERLAERLIALVQARQDVVAHVQDAVARLQTEAEDVVPLLRAQVSGWEKQQ